MKTVAKGGGHADEILAAGGFVQRPWGGFQTIEEGPGYKVKRLLVAPGQRLSLQRHRHRAESWIVIEGAPRMIVSGRPRRLRGRAMIRVPRGAWHRIENPGADPVTIIEVQHGEYLGEDDIIRREDDYGRVTEVPRRANGPEPQAAPAATRRRPPRSASQKSRARP